MPNRDDCRKLPFSNKLTSRITFSLFGDLVGSSPGLKKVREQIDLVAGTNANVLILGESGTGKELAARAIHERSQRRDRPLVPDSRRRREARALGLAGQYPRTAKRHRARLDPLPRWKTRVRTRGSQATAAGEANGRPRGG
jgi:hypothetical protein